MGGFAPPMGGVPQQMPTQMPAQAPQNPALSQLLAQYGTTPPPPQNAA